MVNLTFVQDGTNFADAKPSNIIRKDAFAGQRQRIKSMKPSAKSREWVFFRDESGRIAFNPKCNECAQECKQSFRATLVRCHVFETKDKARS